MNGDAPPAPLILADARRVGAVAAELVRNRLLARPRARLGLEPGRAPAEMFAALRAHAAAGQLPSANATVLALEAHAGPQRLARELDGIALGAMHDLDDVAERLERDGEPGAWLAAAAERHASLVEAAPLDLVIVGLDADGGVALDAPPARRASGVRPVVPAGLTVGLGTLYRAREIIVLATGAEIAPALRAMLEEPPSEACPASLLRDHPRITVIATGPRRRR